MSDEQECPGLLAGLTGIEWVLLLLGVLALALSILLSRQPDTEDPGPKVEVEIRRGK